MVWSWLILSYLSLFIFGFSDNLRGPLFYEIMEHFHVNDTQGALFFSLSSLAAFMAALVSIPLLKRTTFLRLLQWTLLVMGLSTLGLSQARSYLVLLLSASGLGASMGAMGICQNALVSQATPEKWRSQALSGLHSMYGLASFAAPLVVGFKLHQPWKWPTFFVLASGISLVIVVVSFFLPKVPAASAISAVETRATAKPSRRLVVWISLLVAFYVVTEILVATRLSLYSIREYGISAQVASHHVTGFFLGLLLGRLAGFVCRIPGRYRDQLIVSLTVSILGYIIGLYISPWFFTLTGFGMSIFYPVAMAYLSEFFRGLEKFIFPVVMAVQYFSIVVMHLMVGAISDEIGLKWAFHLGILFLVICAVSLWRVEVEKPK